MTTLVVGASGATGRLVVMQLLEKGEIVNVIVRSSYSLPDKIRFNQNVNIIEASILDLSHDELKQHLYNCNAVVSCLGHSLTFKGVYGHPRRLVTSAVERLCEVIQVLSPVEPIKFILMNTTGNKNVLAGEKVSIMQTLVVGLIRYLIPPHADNEKAAKYLQSNIGFNHQSIQWVVVRPDTLTNDIAVSPYSAYQSPTRSAIFDAGKTSRMNVAHFMKQLIIDTNEWCKWEGQMPVIYNQE